MRLASAVALLVATPLLVAASAPVAQAVSTTAVMSQIYGAGGNAGAAWLNDYVELYNKSGSPLVLTGWSLQYASATGTTWTKVNLSGSIPANGYFLIQLQSGGAVGAPLPSPDQSSTTINMSGTTGKLALTNSTITLTGGCPVDASIVDFVGYGATADCREGTANAPAPSATAAIFRVCAFTDHNKDSDQNNTDFVADAAAPRNSSSPDISCLPTPARPSSWGSIKTIYR